MKRIFSLLIVIAVLLTAVSCSGGKIDTSELKDYELDGVSFSLPRYMRRTASEGYDASFDNLTIFFMVKKVSDEMLEIMGVERADGADAYFEALMKKSGLDKNSVFYEKDTYSDIISFRYSYDSSEGENSESNMFYYVILAGEGDNFWYFEICCPEEAADDNLSKFDSWRNGILLTK